MPDWMSGFPAGFDLPLGEWIDRGMEWVLTNWGAGFSAFGDGLLQVLVTIERFLLWVPWFVIILAVMALGWWAVKRWWAGLVFGAFLLIIGSFGYWDLAMQTLAIIITAVFISLIIGIPTGILMARSNFAESLLKPVLDFMQTMPSFVYLIPALMLFGLGKVPAVFATVIYAVPPVIRLTNVGIRQVSPSVVEAARSMGATSWQLLKGVQMPLAVPSIMVGINQTTLMALAMVVIASMIGARTLGLEVLQAINRIDIGRGVEAGLSIVLLAIIIDRITGALGSRPQKTAKT
jgi:glycine betaine/proline transport system permease protein